MTGPLDIKEFIAGYLAEAEELLSASSANLLAVDDAHRRGTTHPRAVRELFRSLHTLKGLSAMVGAEAIVDVAHEMETLLRASDRAGGRLPHDAVDTLLRGLRCIEERVAQLAKGAQLTPAPRELIELLASLRVDDASPQRALAIEPELLALLAPTEREHLGQLIANGKRAVRVEFAPSLERSAHGQNITSVREAVGRIGEIVKVVPRSIASVGGKPASIAFLLIVVSDATDAEIAKAAGASVASVRSIAAPTSPPASSSASATDATAPSGAVSAVEDDVPRVDVHKSNVVRVDVARLDDALDHLSALVVTRSRLERAAQELARGTGSVRALLHIVGESGKQIRDLRASIMRARMVPVRDVLDRAPLIVRGLSKTSGKQVRLVVNVGDSELDKSVADRLFPAVVHVLRNAVDHAIESATERRAAGKSDEGQIHVTCRARSDNQLELIVEDDGRGIDRAKVAARAGVPVPANDDDLLTLITRPGLSTRDEVTQTSGRGIGMDIVRRIVVDELGGELRLQTALGKSTRFTFVVPLSVTILDVFSFRCGGRVFVVPVSAVDDLAEIDPRQVHRAPGVTDDRTAKLLSHRNATIPLFRLSTLLHLAADPLAGGSGIGPALAPSGGPSGVSSGTPSAASGVSSVELRTKAIIVRRNSEVFGFEVDKLIGQQEVVVRPLQDPLVRVVGIAGSTDLGDGQATLVLDLHALAQTVSGARRVSP